ncbi:hypothetical protein [Synechococcus sp. CBW1107]|uniref:hypothetical protein n=1 Tax=Synechococcus sp. CBW1107 TaxID=2789857 RepID=UPI002AD2C49D|nr:hypothetical protein [Synechococcus sp. CBW1107]CAK6697212.1 hypothetical protein IFHNHDMJ_02181 [Synechococcus sp. CBW1107]
MQPSLLQRALPLGLRALALGAVALALPSRAQLVWQPMPGPPPPVASGLRWEAVPVVPQAADTPTPDTAATPAGAAAPAAPAWQPVVAGEHIEVLPDGSIAGEPEPEPIPVAAAPTLPTYGGFRDLYRGDRWYPSISTIVPMAFGPKGLMAGVGLSGSDCTIESKQCINYPTITLDSLRNAAEAVMDSYIGFGDPDRAVSVLITQLTQNTIRAAQNDNFLNGNQTGFAISRNFGPNTALKIGAEGLIRWGGSRNTFADRPKSAFGVLSHRIQLNEPPTDPFDESVRWFPDLYLTVGAGNGQFRPLDQVISSQIQAAKDAGCWFTACSPERTRDAFLKGTEWGRFYPIGSVALAVTDQLNLITEWTGRNLNVSVSWQPLREVGWTITPGIGNLIQNSDYGKNVNIPACRECDMGDAITTRPLFYLRSMINIRF